MADPLHIKVCGMKDPANLEEVALLGPDFLGHIFYPPSPRYVGKAPEAALFAPREGIRRVGVFVNEEVSSVMKLVEKGWIDLVQLHGKESPDYCRHLRAEGVEVIKALQPEQVKDGALLHAYGAQVDYLLVDTPTAAYGGSGRKFDWSLLKGQALPRPLFLSGGIGPGDEAALESTDLPALFALDLNSRFESAPGLKDAGKLRTFIQHIRQTRP